MDALDRTIQKVNSGLAMFYVEDLKDQELKQKFLSRLDEEIQYQQGMIQMLGTSLAKSAFKRLPKTAQLAAGHQALLATLETIKKRIE